MKSKTKRSKRIGIYAGAFDPVHTGHITFALQAIRAAKLDGVVFMPERRPRHKPGAEHFAHRVAMLKAAVEPHPDLAVLELVDRYFTVRRTWPQLQAIFHDTTFVILMGSDTAAYVPEWPLAEQLLKHSELVVGVRSNHQLQQINRLIQNWKTKPRQLYIFESYTPDVSSTDVREALQARRGVKGLLTSVQRYAHRNWLYISLENS